MNYLEIVDIQGREILDSRGNPTVEAEITSPTAPCPGLRTVRRIHRRV